MRSRTTFSPLEDVPCSRFDIGSGLNEAVCEFPKEGSVPLRRQPRAGQLALHHLIQLGNPPSSLSAWGVTSNLSGSQLFNPKLDAFRLSLAHSDLSHRLCR